MRRSKDQPELLGANRLTLANPSRTLGEHLVEMGRDSLVDVSSLGPSADTLPQNLLALLARLIERVERVDANLRLLDQRLNRCQLEGRDAYSTAEVAAILERAPFTVREWCRLGRIEAHRAKSGRGPQADWRISHDELCRIQSEGLLPTQPASAIPTKTPRSTPEAP